MKTLLLTLILLSSSIFVLGQTQTVTTSDGKKVILNADGTWKYDKPQEVLKEIKTDYKNFEGDNCGLIIDFVGENVTNFVQNEFETKKEYLFRLKEFIQTKKIEKLNKIANQIVLVSEPNGKYDAENQEFGYFMYKQKTRGCEIGLMKWEEFLQEFRENTSFLKLKIKPDAARDNKSKIRLAINGFPLPCNLGIGLNPKICIVPSKFIFFNIETGEIYQENIPESKTF